MLKRKTLFIDCDDTLIIHGAKKSFIPKSSYKAITALKENKHRLVLATGRSNYQVSGLMRELDISDAVLFNGAVAIVNGETIYDNPIGNGEVAIMIRELLKKDNSIYLVDKEYQYIKDPDNFIIEYIIERMRPGHKNYDNSYLDKVKELDDKERDYYFFMALDKNKVVKDFSGLLKNLQINKWEDNIIDISNIGVSKYSGLKIVQNFYQIADDDIYAFGDGYNDIEMIKNVKNGVAMGNSPIVLKKHASYIAPRIEQDGFFRACQKLNLI